MLQNHLLSWLIGLPIAGSVAILLAGGNKQPNRARWIALITSLVSLVLCAILCFGFNPLDPDFQFQEKVLWIKNYHIYYALGIDGISLLLICLTVFTTLIVILSAWFNVKLRLAEYMAVFLMIQALVIGSFAALDAILFYVFWEAMLIPMCLSIGIWGSTNRSYAAIKFFLYTFLGSVLMLLAFLYLATRSSELNFLIPDFYSLKLNLQEQIWIFLALILAFGVKVPLWPVHTWLPDAHTEAPTGGSVVLAALMLKLGSYGFLRFILPIVPDASQLLAVVMIGLALVAIIYVSLIAWVQQDMKRLIAYSSVAHMGFVTLACFVFFQGHPSHSNSLSLQGAILHMISHAFTSSAMFLVAGMLIYRFQSRLIKDYSGVATDLPTLATFSMLFFMANLGLPGTSAFVGEFLILISAMSVNFWITVLAATTLILSAVYTLYLYKRVFWGNLVHPLATAVSDIQGMEKVTLLLLVIPILWIGFYPKSLLDLTQCSVDRIIELSWKTKLPF